jgi:DNA repair exonuclease SbcCD nuclease subunit
MSLPVRLVHLADLHLGFRQYQRLTPGGINQREADVARTFERAIDRVIELAPEVVVIAGDIFHSVRPSNPAILHAFIQFSRLMQALPNSRVVMIAGNHDMPRSAETGCILQLFSRLGISVVDREPQRLSFPELNLSVLAVPHNAAALPKLDPDPAFTHNVLLLHGEIEGVLPSAGASPERASLIIPMSEISSPRWSYVALGHYHVHRKVADNAYYSGATDYTSNNTWAELTEERMEHLPGKGFVEWHFESATALFRPLPSSRAFIDLPPISADELTISEIDDRIRTAVEYCEGGIDDRVVRLRIHDMPRYLARELDHRAIRDYKRRALNFFLDIRGVTQNRRSVSGSAGRSPSLEEVLREALAARLLPGDLDRNRLVELGVGYLSQADKTAMTTAALPEA